ncbi:MAG: preprotein translocase subunit SecG [Lentisphaerota bacterium]
MIGIVKAVLLALEVIVCFLMIVIILLQKSKSEGLGLAFGSGMGEALFGSRAGNVLTRLTAIFAVIFLANTLVLGIVLTRSRLSTSLMDRAAPVSSAPMGAMQGAPQGVPQQPQGAGAQPPSGAPTLPGTSFDDSPAPAAAPQPAPVQQEIPLENPAETQATE